MIIRNQDKKSITNFQQLTDVGIIKNDIMFSVQAYYPFSIGNDYSSVNLGLYSTEEKAIKVLDMICEAYVKSQALYIDRENNARVITQNIAMQMPSDEEVDV